jgi:NAD-dependent deacetylase
VPASPADLAALIRERQPCVVLTGAGVSTESGIPDFRSPGGVWARFDPARYATIDAFRRDPVEVWSFYRLRYELLDDVEPNAGHRALAELERRGYVRGVMTQNVDGLHARAGTRELVEVHGTLSSARCLECGTTVGEHDVRALLVAAAAPGCPRCGAILKPDVVMFGELLPEDAFARAAELSREAALMLVVGSTLEVYPVAGLPLETLAAGGALAIVNRGPTALDGEATLRIEGAAGETLAAVAELLRATRRPRASAGARRGRGGSPGRPSARPRTEPPLAGGSRAS